MWQGICNVKSELAVSEENETPQINVEDDTCLPLELEAKNGDTFLITETMEKEENLLRARAKEENLEQEVAENAWGSELRFSKLDELLTQTQLYSQFLLEKMDAITFVMPTLRFVLMFTSNGPLTFQLVVLISRIIPRTLLK